MDNQTTNNTRFISLRLKWAFGTAVGSLIIFLVVTLALFTAFTQNLFRQERGLLNQGMTTISQQLAKSSQPLTRRSIERLIDPNNDRSIIRGADYQRPVIRELSDGHLIVNIYNPQGKKLLSTGAPDVGKSLVNERQVSLARGREHQVLVGHTPIYSQGPAGDWLPPGGKQPELLYPELQPAPPGLCHGPLPGRLGQRATRLLSLLLLVAAA